jgi:uncharacterized phage protein gp47/JayE
MAELERFTVKDALEIRDDFLRTVKNGLFQQRAATVDVGPNTDWWILGTALGNELAVVGANAMNKADQQMPDTATEEDIDRIAALFDRARQSAAGSVGNVLITASATAPIETGRQLTDSAGLRYEVVVGGNYEDQSTDTVGVPIRAIDTGDATNHAAGDVLRWVNAPPYCSDSVTVASGGLVNGIDDEDDEVLRSRILAILQVPPGAGNWEHVAELGEASSSSVQKFFVYPAIQGGATVHGAAVAAPTATNKSRIIASATMSGVVEPYVKGKLPTHAGVTITTVADVNADVAFALSLPEAPTASPPGPGGGWTDATPWPAPDGVTYFRHTVTAVTSETVFTVDAQTAPTAGVTRIAWLSPTNWQLYTARVVSYTGSAGAYVITIDRSFTDIATGSYIWPECQNAQTYVDAVLAQFALMGPGEKSSNASALIRGFRHPPPGASWPYQIGPAMLRAVTGAGTEILAAHFLHRTDGTTTLSGAGGSLSPQVPAALTDPPKCLVPRHISFYRIA